MKNFPIRQFVVLFTIIATITINSLANILPLNGKFTGEISDSFSVFFVPAGYVFSIWGVIYLGLIVYGIFQFLPKNKNNKLLEKISLPLIVANLANSVWIFFWHYDFPVASVLPMLALLGSLIIIYEEIFAFNKKTSLKNFFWFVKVPFSIYLGWISVATIANITVALYVLKWEGFGITPELWGAIMIIVAGFLTLIMNLRRSDVTYMLVVIWALIGIAVKFPGNLAIVTSVIISLLIILGSDLFVKIRSD